MPINYEPPGPLAPGISEAYGGAEAYAQFLPQRIALAGQGLQATEGVARIRAQQQLGAQQIAAQSQGQVNALNAQQAQQQYAMQAQQQQAVQQQQLLQQRFQQEMDLQKSQVSQQEMMHLSRLKNAHGAVDQALANNDIDQDTANAYHLEIATGENPIQMKIAQQKLALEAQQARALKAQNDTIFGQGKQLSGLGSLDVLDADGNPTGSKFGMTFNGKGWSLHELKGPMEERKLQMKQQEDRVKERQEFNKNWMEMHKIQYPEGRAGVSMQDLQNERDTAYFESQGMPQLQDVQDTGGSLHSIQMMGDIARKEYDRTGDRSGYDAVQTLSRLLPRKDDDLTPTERKLKTAALLRARPYYLQFPARRLPPPPPPEEVTRGSPEGTPAPGPTPGLMDTPVGGGFRRGLGVIGGWGENALEGIGGILAHSGAENQE